jgi:hypothetical protein
MKHSEVVARLRSLIPLPTVPRASGWITAFSDREIRDIIEAFEELLEDRQKVHEARYDAMQYATELEIELSKMVDQLEVWMNGEGKTTQTEGDWEKVYQDVMRRYGGGSPGPMPV